MTKNHEPPDQNAVLRILHQDLEAENERLRTGLQKLAAQKPLLKDDIDKILTTER